jgi:hypothetical protein
LEELAQGFSASLAALIAESMIQTVSRATV